MAPGEPRRKKLSGPGSPGARNHAHYEEAFKQYLADHRVPFVTVEQLVRRTDAAGPIKNFDLLVHPADGATHYIVDVKGKRFPSLSRQREVFWENWIHGDDLEGLYAWEEHFGPGYTGLLVFVYWLQAELDGRQYGSIYRHRERSYLMVALTAQEFAAHARTRSLRWQALYVPVRTFVGLVRPVERFVLT